MSPFLSVVLAILQ